MLTLTNVHKSFKKRLPAKNWKQKWLTPHYEQFHALQNINFNIAQGEKVAFIGPNGAGKSTTIKCILGILHHDQGEIALFGMNPKTHRKQIAHNVTSVFGQRSQLLYHLPLADSFAYARIMYEIPPTQYHKRRDYLTHMFGMQPHLHTPVRKLSLGQRMKGEIITSLLHQPKAIFLDEPTVGLDIIAKKTLYTVLNEIHKAENITIFLTSHDMADIQNLCDRAIVINSGNILFDDSMTQLHQNFGNQKTIHYKLYGELETQTISVDTREQNATKTIKQLLESHDIEDLEIKNIELETMVEQFYH